MHTCGPPVSLDAFLLRPLADFVVEIGTNQRVANMLAQVLDEVHEVDNIVHAFLPIGQSREFGRKLHPTRRHETSNLVLRKETSVPQLGMPFGVVANILLRT